MKTGLKIRLFISCVFKERISLYESVYQGTKQTGANYISLRIKKTHIIITCSNLKNKKTNKREKKNLQWKVCPGIFILGKGRGVGGERHYCTFKIY